MPKAAQKLLSQRAPKRLKNDAYDEVNSAKNRYRDLTMIHDNDWGKTAGGQERDPEAYARQYPVMLNKPKPDRDTKLRLKQEYISQQGAGGVNLGEAHLNDSDLKVIEDIEKQKQTNSFESFVASYYDMNDPATAKLVEEMMPEYYEKRQESIEHMAELQKQLALIDLRGPKSKQDLMVLYLVNTGAIPLPKGTLFEPREWSKTNEDFTRGILNPRRYFSTKIDKRNPIGSMVARRDAGGARYSGGQLGTPSWEILRRQTNAPFA